MGRQVIRQPDGRYAIWSSIPDAIVVFDATREEIIEDYVQASDDELPSDLLDLAFLGAVVEYGWLLALSLEEGWIEAAEMDWWQQASRRALQLLETQAAST